MNQQTNMFTHFLYLYIRQPQWLAMKFKNRFHLRSDRRSIMKNGFELLIAYGCQWLFLDINRMDCCLFFSYQLRSRQKKINFYMASSKDVWTHYILCHYDLLTFYCLTASQQGSWMAWHANNQVSSFAENVTYKYRYYKNGLVILQALDVLPFVNDRQINNDQVLMNIDRITALNYGLMRLCNDVGYENHFK